eukprot:4535329-Amphidinium_carterae.3
MSPRNTCGPKSVRSTAGTPASNRRLATKASTPLRCFAGFQPCNRSRNGGATGSTSKGNNDVRKRQTLGGMR